MGTCSCGAVILTKVGQDFIITPERRIVWMRRRSDTYSCLDCGRMYDFAELMAVVAPSIAATEPAGEAVSS